MINPSLINLNAIKSSPLNHEPFPYLIINNFLDPKDSANLLKDFPAIKHPGSFPLNQLHYGEWFAKLISELEGQELRNAIEKKFNLDLTDRPTMITVRGKTRDQRDGKIHTDSRSKLITLLLYMNPVWTAEGGKLRLLNNSHDLENYVAEIPPLFGHCVLFKVTDNCWHGHHSFVGDRKSIQLNYVVSQKSQDKQLARHSFTARLKRWFKPKSEY